MKKITIIILFLLMQIFALDVIAYESVTSTTQTATTYLEVRPGSNKTNSTLTLTQLNNYTFTVKSLVSAAKTKMYDINVLELEARIAAVEQALDGVNTSTFNNDFDYYYSLYEELFSIYGATIESKVVEGRGMWHRPFERNLTEVLTTLQEMKDMSINMLYVETFWLGRLIYPSNVPGTYQHGFTTGEGYGEYGNNLLLAFVEEGKKMGIEVHAWVENFFVGYGTSYLDSPILSSHPEWISYNYDYSVPQRSEVNYLFMDPANPEVRRYLKDIYAEIVSTMDVGSIHLDYIRYPVAKNTTSTSPTTNLDTGYSDYAEAEFKSLYGYTGDLRALVVSNYTAAAQWKEYKKEIISDFVAGVYYTVKNANPEIGLSTAIFGNVSTAINEKMQDWASWADDGLIEIITPMSYYQSSSTVASETLRLTDLVGNNSFSYAGLAPTYMGYNEYLNTTQIQAALSSKAQGTVFFASQFYMYSKNDYTVSYKTYALEVQDVLSSGVFRNDSILPHDDADLVISTLLDYTIDKANRIYVPREGMTQANLDLLIAEFDRIKALPNDTAADLLAQINEFKAIPTSSYASGAARDRIAEDRNYLVQILEIKQQRMVLDVTIDISVNPDPDLLEEAVLLDVPSNLRIDGNVIRWDAVADAARYELVQTIDSVDHVFNVNGTSYSLDELNVGSYEFKVRSIGDGFFFETSAYSPVLTYEIAPIYLTAPENIHVDDFTLYFDAVSGAESYTIYINFSDFTVTTTSFDLSVYNLGPGTYEISVKANGNGFAIIDSPVSTIYVYTIERELTPFETEISLMLQNELKEWLFFWMNQD